MAIAEKTSITVEATINAPVEKVWNVWTDPKHIVKWNNASEDWHTPRAENDLREGGKFTSRMEAKDGSTGFDFSGEYKKVEKHKRIDYVMEDGREVKTTFTPQGNTTTITETFDAENTNPIDLQRLGWQAILNNFKKHVENLNKKEKIHFEIKINAPVELVYKTMLEEDSYKEWTSEFNPSSNYKGSWEKGSKMLFSGTDKDGKVGGMVSRIKENIPNQFLSIEHIGILDGDKEITNGPEVEGWAGALENYTFKEDDGKTLLLVDMDSNEEFKSYFEETWPKALNKLKTICENLTANNT